MAFGSIELIIGCMYSGKSTEIQRRIKRHRIIGNNVLVIKHSCDTRYDDGSQLSTHDKQMIPCYSTNNLDFITNENGKGNLHKHLQESRVIVIEEAQFFNNLFENVAYAADKLGKIVIVAGLDGDFNREPFPEIVRLIPHAEKVLKLSALCVKCSDGTPGNFSKRITKSTDKILVGSTDDYIAVCRKCYNE